MNKQLQTIISFVLTAVVVFSLAPSRALAVTQADIDAVEARRQQLAAQKESIQAQIDELTARQVSAEEKKSALEERNRIAQEDLNAVLEQIQLYSQMIEEQGQKVDMAREKEENQLALYRTRVRAMEENGGYSVNMLGVMMNATNLSALLTTLTDIHGIMQRDRAVEDAYIAAREEYERVKAEYEDTRRKYDAKQEVLEDKIEELQQLIRESAAVLSEISVSIEDAQAEYEAAAAAEVQAENEIAELVARRAEEQRAAAAAAWAAAQAARQNSASGESGDSSGAASSSSEKTSTGSLLWPVPGCYNVSSDYGERDDPFTGEERNHAGMDIDGYGHEGGSIVAADDGTVVTSGYNDGYGNYVVIDHGNGMTTLYAHMSGTTVAAGSTVSQGETIGMLGSTGRATGTHCHVEVFVDGSRVDPADYLSAG